MQGTAWYDGEGVVIVEVQGSDALVTPGQAALMKWVPISDLDSVKWIIHLNCKGI